MDMFCSDKTGTLTQNITTIESEFPWCEASEQGLLSFALLASEQTQNAEDVIDTMLFKCKQEVHAAFNRHTPHLLAFRSCCQDDRIHCCDLLSQSCGYQGQRIMKLAWCFPLSFLMKGVRSRGPFHEDIFRVRRVGDRTFRP